MLLRKRRVSSGRGGAFRDSAQRDCRPGVRSSRHATALDGLRSLPSERHRQPAAQGLAGLGDSCRALRHPPAQRVDLRWRTEQLELRGAEVHPAGRHAQEPGRRENAGGLHQVQGARRRDRRPSSFRRGGGHRRGAGVARLVGARRPEPVPRVRQYRASGLQGDDHGRRPPATGVR